MMRMLEIGLIGGLCVERPRHMSWYYRMIRRPVNTVS